MSFVSHRQIIVLVLKLYLSRIICRLGCKAALVQIYCIGASIVTCKIGLAQLCPSLGLRTPCAPVEEIVRPRLGFRYTVV